MSANSLAAMREEVAALPADLATLTGAVGEQGDGGQAPGQVVLTGSGDSLFAAQAAQYAFAAVPGLTCIVRSTQQLLDYGTGLPAGETLLIGISASGGSEGVASALRRARAAGLRTLAVVGAPDTLVGGSADAAIVAELPHRPPSPGIRSYQASLLTLLLVSARLGPASQGNARLGPASQGNARLGPASEGNARLGPASEGVDLPGLAGATLRLQEEPARLLAARLTGTTPVQVLGGGPALGSARYAAAKLAEGAGIPALGQDLEEWWHVERFATPATDPLVVLAPPGPSHERAVRLCAQARSRGHWVAAVADQGDEQVAVQADLVLPMAAGAGAAWSPLIEHLFAAPLAIELATLLGRSPFHRR